MKKRLYVLICVLSFSMAIGGVTHIANNINDSREIAIGLLLVIGFCFVGFVFVQRSKDELQGDIE